MRILLISNSARGHAIAEAFTRSSHKPEIITISTVNAPGIRDLSAEFHVGDIMNFAYITDIAKKVKPDFAFIAPDDPIGGGLADRLLSIGIKSVAPKKALARIESSKAFARALLAKAGIKANPVFRSFSSASGKFDHETAGEIRAFIENKLRGHYVVKYDALRGGKGVKVSGEHLMTVEMGVKYAQECIEQCGSVVIEEKFVGVEFSLMSFVSGKTVVDMPAVQDHKRANAYDLGPNTGGMGTYSDANHCLPFLTDQELEQASDISKKVAEALLAETGEPYTGILYGGFMATDDGVKVIEYNARFGDPEALNVLPILESDFVDICRAIIDGSLTKDMVRFAPSATVCKYIVPKSYPEGKKEAGEVVQLPKDIPPNARMYFGDVTTGDNGSIHLGSSRAIAMVGIGETLTEAEQTAQLLCEKTHGPVRFRGDIATMESVQKRVEFMNKLRR